MRALLEVRIRRLAWAKNRAINTIPHTKESLKEWTEVASKHGICYSTLRYRANRLGWDLERAATRPPMTPREVGLMTKEKYQRGLNLIFSYRQAKKTG